MHWTALNTELNLDYGLNSTNSNIKYEIKLESKHQEPKHQTECSSEKVVGATLAANAIWLSHKLFKSYSCKA